MGMSIVIRKMRVDDIKDVKRVDLITWQTLVEKNYPQVKKMHPRTDKNILSYMRADPDGSIVAVDESAGIVGTSFSHVWGKTGWVGPVSVLPSYQNRGLGKELLKGSLKYLDESGCADIGLETMPENVANLGLYLRVGLKPSGLILIMGRLLGENDYPEEPSGDVLVSLFSESTAKQQMIAQMKRVSSNLQVGLDYTSEVSLTEENEFGDTLVATAGDRVIGFAIVHTVPKRERMSMTAVRAICVDPKDGDRALEPLLDSAELMGYDANSPEISVPVPAKCARAADLLLSRGYSVVETFERMMWLGEPGISPRSYNLCSWSG